MKRIPLTLREFHLLIEEILPGYNSSFKNKPIEAGKGSDFHYSRKVVELETNETLSITFTINSQVGIQDWIRCGDFYIDHDKKDIYDVHGELLSEVKPEPKKEKTQEQIHDEMVENGEIDEFKSDSWLKIDVDSLVNIVELTKKWAKQESNLDISDIATVCYDLGIKNKINAEKLWTETFQNVELKQLSKKRLKEYFIDRKAKYEQGENFDVTFTIDGQEFTMKKKAFDKFAKEIEHRSKDVDKYKPNYRF